MPSLAAIAETVLCSFCGIVMRKIPTRYARQYWVCPKCGRTAATHPDGSLMSSPADRETRELRKQVHKALAKRFLDKRSFYRWLEANTKEGRVGFLDATECQKILQQLKD